MADPNVPDQDLNPYRAPLEHSDRSVGRGHHHPPAWAGILFLFRFKGRMPRNAWWTIMFMLPVTAGLALELAIEHLGGNWANTVVLSVVGPTYLWVGIASHVKRLHNRDRTGWWLLVGFIPVIGLIWLVVELCALRGTAFPNRFGLAASKDLRATQALLWAGIIGYAMALICVVLLAEGAEYVLRTAWPS